MAATSTCSELPPAPPQIASALRGARAVIAVSRALADKARALGAGKDRVHLLYNGVDGARFRPGDKAAARDALGLQPDARLVIYVGNLKESKGCLDLLEAFPAVLARHPQARLAFVGSGPAGPVLERRARQLGVADCVQLAGARPHEELPTWMQAADLLALPSHNEGVPNVVLEAMACGLPVVASDVGGIPEVLPKHAGVLVPAHDQLALARALADSLQQDWQRDAIIEHAGTFRWDDNVQRLDRILRDAAGATLPG